jgi:hypothetical protein
MTKEELLQQILVQPEITKEYATEVIVQLQTMSDQDLMWLVQQQLVNNDEINHTENAKRAMVFLGDDDTLFHRVRVIIHQGTNDPIYGNK